MAKTTTKKLANESYAKNKKAFAEFEIIEKFTAGIALLGSEVKSIREGKMNLKGSYIDIWNGEAWLHNAHISGYKSGVQGIDPVKKRKLLLHKKEIEKLAGKTDTEGMTIIPLEVYGEKALIKVIFGLCRGKKKYDHRADIKKRDNNREIAQALKKSTQRG